MYHPYKTQLSQFLQFIFPEHQITERFERDEILIVLSKPQTVDAFAKILPELLADLPEIDHPAERTVIGFCDASTKQYDILLINPTQRDTYQHALLGKIPVPPINFDTVPSS